MTPDPVQTPHLALPRALSLAALALFSLVALSGLAGMVAAAIPMPKSAWTLFGFEFVVTASAVLGFAYAKGGCRVSPAIGLASLGGCIGAASLLGFLSVQQRLGSVDLTAFVAVRCLAAAALGGLALIAGMNGERRSWATLFKGVLAGIPAVVGVAIFALPAGKPILNAFSNLGGFAGFILGTVVFLLLTASASAGVHLVIRSFQIAQGNDGPTRRTAA